MFFYHFSTTGKPENVIDSIISSAKIAFELIDMRQHSGEHKRIGTLDVSLFFGSEKFFIFFEQNF